MAINVKTDRPRALLDKIKDAIRKNEVVTWEVDSDGDFTHSPNQWKNKAWLRPRIISGYLILNILKNNSEGMTKVIYGVYHGRYIEMLLTHFDGEFQDASATALLTRDDCKP